jgi:predicted TIM-barrel fold metal-dependent hydrolase
MFKGHRVIDVHGHMSSPPEFRAFAFNLIALRTAAELAISEERMAPPLARHLRMLDSHNIDLQLISPRPVAMMQWEEPHLVNVWTRATNDVIAQQCTCHPDRFAGVAQLPQHRSQDTSHVLAELERCIGELGFVAALVNPDPGADRQTPGMDDEYWYPLYREAEQLNATLVVHPSISRDPRLVRIPHSYQYNNLTEETLATLLLEHSDVFDTFPKLRIVICHCGGALRRLLEFGQPVDAVLADRGEGSVIGASGETAGGSAGVTGNVEVGAGHDWSDNLFFDTCSYDPHFLATAFHQRGPKRLVFGTEVPGSGSDLYNPVLGAPADDVLAMIDGFDFLTDDEKIAVVHHNPLRVFPLLGGRERLRNPPRELAPT